MHATATFFLLCTNAVLSTIFLALLFDMKNLSDFTKYVQRGKKMKGRIYLKSIAYHRFLCASSRKGCTGLSDVGMVMSAGDCTPLEALISCPIFTLLSARVAKVSKCNHSLYLKIQSSYLGAVRLWLRWIQQSQIAFRSIERNDHNDFKEDAESQLYRYQTCIFEFITVLSRDLFEGLRHCDD